METVDVAVVGAGSAGSAAAAFLAEQGASVCVIERRSLDQAGARWCNGVPGWAFDEARLARPVAPEHRGIDHDTVHLVGGWGPHVVTVSGQDVLEVDMRMFVARLQAKAADAGATLRGGTAVRGRTGGTVHTDRGDVRARWVIDASGHPGAPLGPRPAVPRGDLCTAVQEVFALADADAARAWFADWGADLHHVVCFTGISGGFAILNVRVSGDEVSVLTGTVPGQGHEPATVVQARFVAEHPWIGARRFGGARAIPIRRPATRTTHDVLVRLGDAAGQVYAGHGSGVGAHLIAARLLADTLASGGSVNDYDRTWQRRWGGELAASDLFCRLARSLQTQEIERMITSGLMHPSVVRPSLEQRAPSLTPADLRALATAAARDPALAAKVLPVLARMSLTRGAYRLAPTRPGRHAWWHRMVERVTRANLA